MTNDDLGIDFGPAPADPPAPDAPARPRPPRRIGRVGLVVIVAVAVLVLGRLGAPQPAAPAAPAPADDPLAAALDAALAHLAARPGLDDYRPPAGVDAVGVGRSVVLVSAVSGRCHMAAVLDGNRRAPREDPTGQACRPGALAPVRAALTSTAAPAPPTTEAPLPPWIGP